MQNRITDMLGSRYPLIQGVMRRVTLGAMAADVSNSGGFGQIAMSGLNNNRLKAKIEIAQKLNTFFGKGHR